METNIPPIGNDGGRTVQSEDIVGQYWKLLFKNKSLQEKYY